MCSDTTFRNGSTTRQNVARIDEGAFVPIHDIEHWLTFRGDDAANPALLMLGGPGVGLSAFAPLFAAWEPHFTVVQWDQPGGGATHAKNGDARTGALTIERLVRDAIAVAEHVRDRLGKNRVVLLGASGGSILALATASRRPGLVSACVGTGAFTPAEAAALAAARPALESPPAGATYVAHGLALGDPRALATAAYDRLRADLVSFEARRLGRSFRVPMFFFQGEHDAYSVTDAVRDYVAWIDAPQKLLAIVPGAGHSLMFAAELLLEPLLAHVRPVALEAERATDRNRARP
jgi:pimeloyl-ACP methyl ester carboxylesterase